MGQPHEKIKKKGSRLKEERKEGRKEGRKNEPGSREPGVQFYSYGLLLLTAAANALLLHHTLLQGETQCSGTLTKMAHLVQNCTRIFVLEEDRHRRLVLKNAFLRPSFRVWA